MILGWGFFCETQLLITMHDIPKASDKKLKTSQQRLTLPHNNLLKKLDHMAIDGKTNKRIRGFLTNTSQRVVVDGVSSKAVSVDSGCVLGQLIFLSHK